MAGVRTVGARVLGENETGVATGKSISGVVLDCESGEPVLLATVALKETGEMTITGSEGWFRLHCPEGVEVVHLFINHISYLPEVDVELHVSVDTLSRFCLRERVYETQAVEVNATREEVGGAWDMLQIDPLTASNGAISQTDPVFSLKDEPFVTSSSDFDGRFSVHGSSPEANAFYLDGLVFPSPYHLSGLCSIYDPSNISKFRFARFPVSASMLSSTAAVVDVETKDGSDGSEAGMVNVGVLSSAFSTQRFFSDERIFTSFMARRSYLDLILNNLAAAGNVRIPNFYDVQSSVVWAVDPRRYLKVGVICSGDESRMRATQFVEGEGDAETVIDWHRMIGALYMSIGTRKGEDYRSGGRLTLAWQPYSSHFSIGGSDDERMDWKADRLTLRWDITRKYQGGEVSAGTYTSAFFADFDINFGRGFWLASRNENSAIRLDNDGWVLSGSGKRKWLYSAVYSEVRTKLAALDLRVGARLEAFGGSGELLLTPRVGLRKMLDEKSTLELSFGVSARDPAEEIGNPEAFIANDVRTEKATQVSLVYRRTLFKNTNVEVGGFLRRDRDLLIELEPTVFSSTGKGRGKGLEVAFERRGGKLTLSGNYSYTVSERMDLPYSTTLLPAYEGDALVGLEPVRVEPYWYTSPYEFRHSISFEGKFRVSRSVNVGLKWRYRTGRPYTPIMDVYERDTGGVVASQGRKMSARLPAYSRIDFHVDWTGNRVGVFFEVLNLTNRVNPFNLRYNPDYSELSYYRMIPTTPAFGVKILL